MAKTVEFVLNGKPIRWQGDGGRMLLWVLRGDLGVTGPKYGCGEGVCGACTVLVNDQAVRSCQTEAGSVAGSKIVTIEGLAKGGALHPLQKAFVKHDALQCGFCTPGMILQAYSFLKQKPRPTRREILGAMENNLCRCGSHQRIVQAIQEAAARMRGGAS
jgi:aerobic-type carbon monoxide dehydrogenase small subunit (CoxS/CutS family)